MTKSTTIRTTRTSWAPALLLTARLSWDAIPRQARIMIRIASMCLTLYWLALFVATHIPSRALPNLAWSDKVYHVIAFSGLAFLLAWALPNRQGSWLPHVAIAATIGLAYGVLDELTQQFIPGRTCDVWDVAADAVGIAIGLTAYVILRQTLSHLAWGRRLIQSLSR